MSTQQFPVTRPDPRLLWLPPGLSLLVAVVAVAVLGMREPRAWAVAPILIASVVMLALILRRREVRLGDGTLLRDRGRAFVLLTGPSRVLVLPERSGRRLLLSLEKPQALLDALRSATPH